MFKKLFLLLVITLICVSSKAENHPHPVLTIDTLNYELGDVYKADSVKIINVHWKNTGDADLYFEEIRPGCHCIGVNASDFEFKRFKPQSEGIITITFDLSIPPQEFYRELYIFTNATKSGTSTDIVLHGVLHKGSRPTTN